MHAGESLECLGGNGYVEESGMPRLFRESPLNSIWEGSGNVQCLDVLRAMIKCPASLDAFFAEVAGGRRREPRLAAYATVPARRSPRRRQHDRDPRPPRGRADGPRPPGLPPGPLRRRSGRRRLLRLPPRAATGARPSAPCPRDSTSRASSSGIAGPAPVGVSLNFFVSVRSSPRTEATKKYKTLHPYRGWSTRQLSGVPQLKPQRSSRSQLLPCRGEVRSHSNQLALRRGLGATAAGPG